MRVENIGQQPKDLLPNYPLNKPFKTSNHPEQKELKGVEADKIKKLIPALNNYLEEQEISLKFKVEGDRNRLQVNLIDTKTNKVVQKIPPDEVLNIARYIESMVGIFVDKNF